MSNAKSLTIFVYSILLSHPFLPNAYTIFHSYQSLHFGKYKASSRSIKYYSWTLFKYQEKPWMVGYFDPSISCIFKISSVRSRLQELFQEQISKEGKEIQSVFHFPSDNCNSDGKRHNDINYIESLYFRTSLVFKSKILQISEMAHVIRPSCPSTTWRSSSSSFDGCKTWLQRKILTNFSKSSPNGSLY